ncbi:concanavalin A-like lectin/glucanase domain-containing protein [Paraphysoderma sedebokerense]|nr:concanavalin A-like lectin/glucanase domain-containing protein [Paraphysoderma sedebokerense]
MHRLAILSVIVATVIVSLTLTTNATPLPEPVPEPRRRGSGRRCERFADYFNGTSLGPHWSITTNCPGGISLNNGVLKTRLVDVGPGPMCGPTIAFWPKDFTEGEFEMRMKIAKGPGVVSAFVLRAPDLKGDEIDFEWVGRKTNQIQTNWFIGGVWRRGTAGFHNMNVDMSKGFHTYKIVWTKNYVKWYMNNRHVRTLRRNNRFKMFPTLPSKIYFGVWDASQVADGRWAGVVNKSRKFEAEYTYFKYKVCN